MELFSKNNKKIYSMVLFIVVLAFVLYYIIESFHDLSAHLQQINYTSLFLSFFFTLISYLLSLFIWIDIAAAFGLKTSFMSAARAWSLSQLGKYIPGKAALILVRLDAYENHPIRTIAVATVVEFITAVIAACLLILFSIFFMKNLIPEYLRIIASLSSLFLLIFLHPKLLKYLTNILLVFFKREPIEDFPSFGLI